jgi:hypothetical protein
MNRNILSILFFLSTLCATAQMEEKTYAHTDKEFYLTGEIIWFKIYTVDAASNHPSPLSRIASVEIISADQRPVAQAKITLANGLGSGSFQLPSSIRSGNYVLRVYTNWMKNYDPACFYEKNITILNTLRDPSLLDSLMNTPSPTQPASFDLRLFPESGSLVAGLPGRVAFRIVDRSGLTPSCKGYLINPSGDTLARFQSLRFGMGSFTFTPAENTKYRAVFELEDHRLLNADLPEVEKQGYTMQVTDTNAGQAVVLVRTNIPDNNAPVSLYIFSRLIEQKNISNGEARFVLTDKDLREGISRITLVSGNNTPVAERLWFKAPVTVNISVRPGKETYTTREKVTLDLNATTRADLPVQLNGSMSVILLDSLQSVGQDDLLSYLYLSSELKGSIISPGYYFSGDNPEIRATADLLMLTQGWRRFRPELSGSRPTAHFPYPPEYAGMLVSGKITHRQTGLPAANIPAWLCAPGNYFHLAYSVSDSNGMIQWNLGLIYGTHELVVQPARPGSANQYRIDLLSTFSDAPPTAPLPDFRLLHSASQQLLWHSIGAQAQNVWQIQRRQHFSQPPVPDTIPFYGQPDRRFLLDDYTRFSTMEEVMREYAKETHIKNKNGDFSISLQSDQANQLFFDAPPLILMDGMPVPDFNNVIRFDPLKIRKMEILAKRYFLADTLVNGIISYASYQGDLAGFPLDASAYIQDFDALQIPREFYSPVYETSDQQSSRIPDFRNLLFWEPDLATVTSAGQSRSFYTSDIAGRYAVIVQGITADGKVGKGIATFTVQSIAKK